MNILERLFRLFQDENRRAKSIGPGTTGHGSPLSAENAVDFVYAGQIMFCNSENVESATYSIEDKILVIQYKGGGSPWSYEPITELQAIDFTKADSKNGWLWDNVRIRGTKHGHRVNARRVR